MSGKWVTLDEYFAWWPTSTGTAYLSRSYMEIPNELWERLKKATDELDAIQEELRPFEKDHHEKCKLRKNV